MPSSPEAPRPSPGSSAAATTSWASPRHSGCGPSCDFSGITPLYWHQGADVAVFSNRTTTIGALVDEPGWDLGALGWVLAAGNLFGERMPTREVSYVPPGLEAGVDWGASEVVLQRAPTWVWPAPSDETGRDNLSPAEWDVVTEELVANFRALKSFGTPVRLALSGGKDSRLCLALSKAAGLEEVVSLRTNGPADSPEVECAAAVAAAAGFPHERIGPPPGPVDTPAATTSEPFPVERWWRRLAQHVYRFEAVVSPWDGMTDTIRRTTLNIRGIGGELYRRGNVKRVRHSSAASTDELARLYGDGADRLGVLRPKDAAFQEDWRARWFETAADQVRFDLLPEKWYVDHRLSHWNGPLAQATAGTINVLPLLSARVAAKNMELSAGARASDRLHFEVMRRTAPELLSVPILNDVWAPVIADSSPIDLPRQPYPVALTPTTKVLSRPKWDFLETEAASIDQLFRDARKTEMNDICNLRRLRRLLRKTEDFGEWKGKQVYSAIGVALALLGRGEQVVDDCRRT